MEGVEGKFFPRGFGQSPWFFYLILGMNLQPLRKSAKVKISFLLLGKRNGSSGYFFAFDFGNLAQARFLL
ncbi:hypothetical protein EAC26_13880 [Enterococcus faecium]|nr:hypothetical protein C0W45_10155 [Latilactobacillus curvatus]EGP5302125.1 hypothetical protein [Enterococcus faecium]EGP5304888.1 hypothetical protein [Enterococcus faecium]EGP5552005.1 hypothetical protein [Enterococcus faecium]EGP5607974.1 hypothetical protein [Enterococcus faecium]